MIDNGRTDENCSATDNRVNMYKGHLLYMAMTRETGAYNTYPKLWAAHMNTAKKLKAIALITFQQEHTGGWSN